jgi:hypothetical protein
MKRSHEASNHVAETRFKNTNCNVLQGGAWSLWLRIGLLMHIHAHPGGAWSFKCSLLSSPRIMMCSCSSGVLQLGCLAEADAEIWPLDLLSRDEVAFADVLRAAPRDGRWARSVFWLGSGRPAGIRAERRVPWRRGTMALGSGGAQGLLMLLLLLLWCLWARLCERGTERE